MTRPVHPIADLFPMMTDEELANLAADIKANGLIHPIVVDKDGLVIDGRNRARACEIAGIEPATVLFEGDDFRSYIVASNIARIKLRAQRTECAPLPTLHGYTAGHLVADGRQRIIVSAVFLTDPPQRPNCRWFCLLLQD
jgi:hypothetical protein